MMDMVGIAPSRLSIFRDDLFSVAQNTVRLLSGHRQFHGL